MTVYISQRDADIQKITLASNPGISFGNRDYRNSDVVIGSASSSTPPSNNNGSSVQAGIQQAKAASERNTTATPAQAGPFSNNVQSSMTETPSQYYIPYEQPIRDQIASYPAYTPKTDTEMLSEAENYANLQINPQVTALQTALQNAIASAGNQKTSIEANYSTVSQTADRLLDKARSAGTESAIARGGGRSGAVEYEVGKLSQPIMEQVTQAENEKAAALTNIDNALGTIQSNYDTSLQSLEAQRGTLVAQQLAAIKDLEYAKQTGSADKILAATQNLAALTNARNEFDNELNLRYTEAIGEVPSATSTNPTITMPESSNNSNSTPTLASGGGVGLRQYVESQGGSVGWDAASGEVTINGRVYTPAYLAQLGAYLVDGKWYIPESAMNSMTQAQNAVYI